MSGCVNHGGADSVIRLASVPFLEQEVDIAASALRALALWQARSGEVFTAVAPDQTCFRVRLTLVADRQARCVPFERLHPSPESPLAITVYQALPDKERFEMVLQKLTELGVCRIVPMQTAHSLSLAERDVPQKKSHRWPDVLLRAARQCRRAMLPELYAVVTFDQALEMAGRAELSLLLYAGGGQWTLQEGIGSFQPQSVALLIGPEGGFSAAECEQARNAGVLPVSLGPRILRTETAAIAATAIVQNLVGDLR